MRIPGREAMCGGTDHGNPGRCFLENLTRLREKINGKNPMDLWEFNHGVKRRTEIKTFDLFLWV